MEHTWNAKRLHQLIATRLKGRKFIVVSNREPFMHKYTSDGSIVCQRPASGMASALHPILMASGGTWIAHGSGSADRETVGPGDRIMVPPDRPGYTLRRVWLTEQQERGYYYGLSNECLWPLCHMTFVRPEFRPSDWETYKEVNQRFADAVLEEVGNERALVFIQDFHFCLLPRLLRERSKGRIVCAQFWHIPWPNREIFRAFPWGQELIHGLLGNDLLGFHVHYHCQNFMETVDRSIEARVDNDRSEISRRGHVTLVRPFPISIDFAECDRLARTPEVTAAMERWLERIPGLRGRRICASIERLDYSKGIPQRLAGIHRFLEEYPGWREKICFVQIAVTSRDDIASYRDEQQKIDLAVDAINRTFATPDWQPVYLLKSHHSAVEMSALHRLADVFMVTSLHDGMNLVAKEYLASRWDERGALILSSFTGASRELRHAISVNPFSIEDIASSIVRALELTPRRRQRHLRMMREQISHQNVYRWAGRMLTAMLRVEHLDDDDEI